MSIDATALPSELLVTPLPLIGCCGLDPVHNAVHKSIWEAFSTNRKADRAPIQYKLLAQNYEFPTAKPKRASYEWYQPKGILKRNWMLKHLHVLPAVVVLFQELEWNDPQWSEKQLQCVSALQALKSALQERNTRLCLVVLQKATTVPSADDVLSSERMASLTSACGINSKMLFMLPHNEHLMGYVLRLESAFLDMAHSYYMLMSRRIRAHRDQLTTAHTTLKIRHQFKLGFIAEIRQDFSTSLKNYSQAYANLDEIRIVDSNCLEVKTVAGFLNYKICRLMFKLKVPRDSINHFISHIDKYKNRIGYKDINFEHYAWLSTQHCVFAELFCEAIKNKLPALQTQHPGIYYHKAAEYTMRRKEAFQQACAILASSMEPNTIASPTMPSSTYSEYFGIRGTKSDDAMSEQQLTCTLLDAERNFNHSSAIINLLGLAMAQFKLYKCLRFRKKLAIDMAEEYFKSGDHAKALTLYSLMLPDYRQDNWSPIFSDVLQKTLRCSMLAAAVPDFVSCSIEALSLSIRYDQNDRIGVLENLWKVFQGVPPVLPQSVEPEIHELWDTALSTAKSPIHIDLDKIIELFDINVTFERAELKNDDIIRVFIIVRLLTDVPIKINNVSLLFTDGVNTYKLVVNKYIQLAHMNEIRCLHAHDVGVDNENENDNGDRKTNDYDHDNVKFRNYQLFDANLKLEPGMFYEFACYTEAQQFFENTQLRPLRTEIQLGTSNLMVILTKHTTYNRSSFRTHNRHTDLDDNITIHPVCNINPTFHLSTQVHHENSTMLVNEYYAISTTICNPYNVFLQNVGLNVSVPPHLRNKVFLTTDVAVNRQKLHSQIQIDIGELSMQSSNNISFYVFSLIETSVALKQRIWYTIDGVQPKSATSIIVHESTTPTSSECSPDTVSRPTPGTAPIPQHQQQQLASTSQANSAIFKGAPDDDKELAATSHVQIEFIDDNRLRKTREDTLSIACGLEFKFTGRFYTLNKKPLTKIYRGENFLLRINMQVQSATELDILESYFICDHNLLQSTYSFKRKSFTNRYSKGDKLEDVIMLRANSTLDEWLTREEFEEQQANPDPYKTLTAWARTNMWRTQQEHQTRSLSNVLKVPDVPTVHPVAAANTTSTIISNMTLGSSSPMATSQTSMMNSSFTSDDNKPATTATTAATGGNDGEEQSSNAPPTTRLIFNKTMEAVHATGHCRGFIKAVLTADSNEHHHHQQQQQQVVSSTSRPYFGVYCIKWRRHGGREENESKFVIHGIEIERPPLNIYCTIDEKMFVKMPMTYKVILHNTTTKTLHLIASLSISSTDNFICSGHKQLDISLFCNSKKELVYNLYPLCVGWQNLPELTLEYNTQVDPSRDAAQNALLSELVERSVPKSVFVLPPLKQHAKC